MYSEQSKPATQENLDYTIPGHHHQDSILQFLRTHLGGFAQEFLTMLIPSTNIGATLEDYISGEVCDFLNDKCDGYMFRFNAKKGADISIRVRPVQVHSLPILLIEAKRLPPTTPGDYVKSGMKRFKTGQHGQDYVVAAMFGYIQDGDFDYWHKQVNLWVDARISTCENPKWKTDDKLRKIGSIGIGEYRSSHSRIQRDPITLYHFWLNLCRN